MFYFEEDAKMRPRDVAKILNTKSEKISEWARDLENYGIISFKKTGLGSYLFRESDVKVIQEYGALKGIFNNPKDAIDILKVSDVLPEEKEDLSWAKNLKDAIWRRF